MPLSGDYEPSPAEWVRNQVAEYEASGGQRANTLTDTGLPVVIVTTRGNKSGKIRKTPLMRVEHDGQYALIASKGGAPEHPVWYHNLVVAPTAVTIQDGPEPVDMVVREVTGDERSRWWERPSPPIPPTPTTSSTPNGSSRSWWRARLRAPESVRSRGIVGGSLPDGARPGAGGRRRGRGPEVISLRLATAEEMYVLPQTDLFSEYRNYLTGIEYCISMVRSHRSHAPVRIELSLPAGEVDAGASERISGSLRRYCDHRISYNWRERRAVRMDGVGSLWVGLPIVLLGFLLVIFGPGLVGRTGNTNLVVDTGGWVFVWLGLWFPLDSIFFTPLAYGQQNRALRRLREADVVVTAAPTSPGP